MKTPSMSRAICAICFGSALLSNYSYAANAKNEGHELSKKRWWELSETSGLDLEASSEEKKGTLGIGFSLGGWYINPAFTGPIDDKSFGQYINRDGLVVGSELSMSATYFGFDKDKISSENLLLANGLTAKEQRLLIQAAYDNLEKCKNDATSQKKDPQKTCESEQSAFDKVSEPVNMANNPLESFWFITFSGAHTNTEFSYLDLETSDKLKQDEDGFALEISGGSVNSLKATRWELGLSYQEGYSFANSNKERYICSPIPDSNFTECGNYRTEPPLKTTRIAPFAAISRQFPSDRVLKGIQLKISYLDDKKEIANGDKNSQSKWLVETPIYLFSNAKNAFSGGLKLSWVSEAADQDDKFAASIFFSKPLDVFK